MPGIPAARRRPFNTRGRSGAPLKRTAAPEAEVLVESPLKKRKYVPGGPGGGGRYVDSDGTEIPVGGTGPGGYNYVGPRGRIGPQNAANGVQPILYERPPRRESRRERPATRPRYSSAAAAAAAVVQGDGFKPREECSWEEFHQDLDIEAKFPVFSAAEVDGVVKITRTPNPRLINGTSAGGESGDFSNEGQSGEDRDMVVNGNASETAGGAGVNHGSGEDIIDTPSSMRRRPSRPLRTYDSMLKGIGTPDTPKVVPLPGPNPREKLTLPKPSFRLADPFISYEQKAAGQMNYVDRTMANVGYQESDVYIRPEKKLIRITEGNIEEELDIAPSTKSDGDGNAAIGAVGVGRVEYDMDEQDQKWLEDYNKRRREEQVEPIKPAIFEITMTKIEKEWHALEKRIPKPNPKPPQTHRPRSSSAAAVNGEPAAAGEEQDSKCAICDDGDCENTNAIVFCDGCDLAVHQECYGVPFIPEGQWLCRKCQLIGRGTPTCIFCPNTDGAFKQTNSSRWSHLLCAIWIPEVSLGNTTFMEPVMDVEKVPKQRWKLTCYLCRQKMGACIQCGNKNCFVAFHVTCARRAKLFLQMKSTHGGPASLDASVLKAFCDKHVPSDWRREHDTEMATADAIDFYHYTMRGRLWADSQQSAMNMAPIQPPEPPAVTGEGSHLKINLIVGGNKRKRNQTSKPVWRLPSGAPVVPSAVYDSVESSLQRFTVRKRRDYAADMCKYWTLKREARRGAALIKRLQLQMETFSSMEITRRNFAGMGAAGRVRLQRRIDFAEARLHDVDKLRVLCDESMKREREKLRDAELLRDLIDIVYFPIPPLLWPIIEKAQALDGKGTFRAGLADIRERMEERFYTSVSTFSTDLGTVFSTGIGMSTVADTAEVQSQIIVDKSRKDLSAEQKEKRKLAKRIIKAIQPALEDAMRKESELCRRPFEKELRDLDLLLETSISSRRDSVSGSVVEEVSDDEATPKATCNGHTAPPSIDVTALLPESFSVADKDLTNGTATANFPSAKSVSEPVVHNSLTKSDNILDPASKPSPHQHNPGNPQPAPSLLPDLPPRPLPSTQPPTPPLSSSPDHQSALSTGGIPWYMEPFDPVGTTVYEERWTGREVARGMSEELSDMDEEELDGLVEGGVDVMEGVEVAGAEEGDVRNAGAGGREERKKNGKLKRRWKGFR
ncbi:nuA3 HAT complex component nto1 [Lambiella insularis]|nr:nuA3 HAT complex component nto1 [Lambiella insularis]